MTSYDVELDCYYRLQEEYLSTRLEQISFVEDLPKIPMQSPGLKKMQSACDNIFNKAIKDLESANFSDGDEGHEVDSPRSIGEISENFASSSEQVKQTASAEGQSIEYQSKNPKTILGEREKKDLKTTSSQSAVNFTNISTGDSLVNSSAKNRSLKNLVPQTHIIFHNDRDFKLMKHFSNKMLLGFRDNILYFFNTQTLVKHAIKVPYLNSIKEIHFFTYSDHVCFVDLVDDRFSNLFSLKIMGDTIVDLKLHKNSYQYRQLLILSRTTKIYQVSEDQYYDILNKEFIRPDYEKELAELVESDVTNVLDLEEKLYRIVTLGFKYKKYLGQDSGLQQVYDIFDDRVLAEGYRFKYGIDQ